MATPAPLPAFALPLKPATVTEKDVQWLLTYYLKHQDALSKRHEKEVATIQSTCEQLFARDYIFQKIPNQNGEFCSTYPPELLIIEADRRHLNNTKQRNGVLGNGSNSVPSNMSQLPASVATPSADNTNVSETIQRDLEFNEEDVWGVLSASDVDPSLNPTNGHNHQQPKHISMTSVTLFKNGDHTATTNGSAENSREQSNFFLVDNANGQNNYQNTTTEPDIITSAGVDGDDLISEVVMPPAHRTVFELGGDSDNETEELHEVSMSKLNGYHAHLSPPKRTRSDGANHRSVRESILLKSRSEGASPFSEMVPDAGRLNNTSELREYFEQCRFSRVRSRFVIPVLVARSRNICRSSTLSHEAEVFLNMAQAHAKNLLYGEPNKGATDTTTTPATEERLFADSRSSNGNLNGTNGSNATQKDERSSVDKQRANDIELLKKLGVKHICDLMVEQRKIKYGLSVCSSEKADSQGRYAAAGLEIVAIPYPGCEFFRRFKDSKHCARTIRYDWTLPIVNAQLTVPDTFTFENFIWNDYKMWDLVTLTQNYLRLMLRSIELPSEERPSSVNEKSEQSCLGDGILVHCISGWDRTPLFVSLLRISLWADGESHASLEPAELLYLTIAYDWLLFSHLLVDRMQRGEDIFQFCFYILRFLEGEEYCLRDIDEDAGIMPAVQSNASISNMLFQAEPSSSTPSFHRNGSVATDIFALEPESPYDNRAVPMAPAPSLRSLSADVDETNASLNKKKQVQKKRTSKRRSAEGGIPKSLSLTSFGSLDDEKNGHTELDLTAWSLTDGHDDIPSPSFDAPVQEPSHKVSRGFMVDVGEAIGLILNPTTATSASTTTRGFVVEKEPAIPMTVNKAIAPVLPNLNISTYNKNEAVLSVELATEDEHSKNGDINTTAVEQAPPSSWQVVPLLTKMDQAQLAIAAAPVTSAIGAAIATSTNTGAIVHAASGSIRKPTGVSAISSLFWPTLSVAQPPSSPKAQLPTLVETASSTDTSAVIVPNPQFISNDITLPNSTSQSVSGSPHSLSEHSYTISKCDCCVGPLSPPTERCSSAARQRKLEQRRERLRALRAIFMKLYCEIQEDFGGQLPSQGGMWDWITGTRFL